MKLSWLIEIIQDHTSGQIRPQCLLMAKDCFADFRAVMAQWWDSLDPAKRLDGMPSSVDEVPVYLDAALPGGLIRVLRHDGTGNLYQRKP